MESSEVQSMSNLWSQAVEAFDRERFDIAEGLLQSVLAKNPELGEAQGRLAVCKAKRGETSQALGICSKARACAPDDSYTLYLCATAQLLCHKIDLANETIDAALRVAPNQTPYLTLKANIALARHHWDEAAQFAEQALHFTPEDVDALRVYTVAARGLDDGELEGRLQQSADRLAADDPDVRAEAGWHCLGQGDYQGAEQNFRDAMRLDPECGYYRNGLLEVLRAGNPIARVCRFLSWTLVRNPILSLISTWLGFVLLIALHIQGEAQQWPHLLVAGLFLYATPALILIGYRALTSCFGRFNREVRDLSPLSDAIHGAVIWTLVLTSLGMVVWLILRPNGMAASLSTAVVLSSILVTVASPPNAGVKSRQLHFLMAVGLLVTWSAFAVTQVAAMRDHNILWERRAVIGLQIAAIVSPLAIHKGFLLIRIAPKKEKGRASR